METIVVQTNFEDYIHTKRFFEKGKGKFTIKIAADIYIEAFVIYDWNPYYIVRVSKLVRYRDWTFPVYKRFDINDFEKACAFLQKTIDEFE